ncbi:uncharacterized protein EDB93DRAFT_1108689 [Suillus bovinus]|uniref:uncharacterized protein n=1 Tax=Suillus bovinus TaxID=48563 RepID=UPI001B85F8D4|nr:uncharacterized protein EDB93DRAFT_1108689 [Suillus bovinus]KAG2129512.1 hypothetical protein EDB93DRAFT_1108689 [Suillus bovinus]
MSSMMSTMSTDEYVTKSAIRFPIKIPARQLLTSLVRLLTWFYAALPFIHVAIHTQRTSLPLLADDPVSSKYRLSELGRHPTETRIRDLTSRSVSLNSVNGKLDVRSAHIRDPIFISWLVDLVDFEGPSARRKYLSNASQARL